MGGVPAEMEHAVPWSKLCALVEPVYPTGGKRPVIDQPGTDTADLLGSSGSTCLLLDVPDIEAS